MEMREPGWWATWFDAAYLMRRSQAAAIINNPEFDSPQWQKDMMLRGHPMVEFRSRWNNDQVRGQSRQLDAMSGLTLADERYQRIKSAAVAMVPHLLDDYGMDKGEAARFREILDPPKVVQAIPQLYALAS